MKKRGPHKRKRILRTILVNLSAGIFFVCLCLFGLSLLDERLSSETYETVRNTAYQTESQPNAQEGETEIQAQDPDIADSEERRASFPIDFDELSFMNSDIFAWISIPDSPVDYPILYREGDDTFYLDHDVMKQERQAGALFIEHYNSTSFLDSNTVIYGHNQRDLSMFGSLHQFEDKNYFDSHQEIIVYTKDYRKLTYTIFSCSQVGDAHILASSDMNENKDTFSEYIQQILRGDNEKQFLRKDVTVSEEDCIITLSTCENGQDDKRYIVQGVLSSVEQY